MDTPRRRALILVLLGVSLIGSIVLSGLLRPAARTSVPPIEIQTEEPATPESDKKADDKKRQGRKTDRQPAPPVQKVQEVAPSPVAPADDDDGGHDDGMDDDGGDDGEEADTDDDVGDEPDD